jgi:hypothetical protein
VTRGAPAVSIGLALLVTACGGGGASSPTSPGVTAPSDNVLPVRVAPGPGANESNTLLTDVTVCVPNTSSCETITDVMVDTGSTGLRILASSLTLALPRLNDDAGHPLGNCAVYADNTYTWGPVAQADVQMAGLKAPAVPIQIVGAADFAGVPGDCRRSTDTADDTPESLGANGILGIGVFRQDCGGACTSANRSVPPIYFSCPGPGCTATLVPLAKQLENPVWRFPSDNNGFRITLPSVPPTGLAVVSGSLVFGIGTEANNGLGSATVLRTDDVGDISTRFGGGTYKAYVDSGTNGLYFLDSPTTGISSCRPPDDSFYCPPSAVTLTAALLGSGGATASATFEVDNATELFRTRASALPGLAGPSANEFAWGLPFFYGRTVFTAIENQSTTGGLGPYVAY